MSGQQDCAEEAEQLNSQLDGAGGAWKISFDSTGDVTVGISIKAPSGDAIMGVLYAASAIVNGHVSHSANFGTPYAQCNFLQNLFGGCDMSSWSTEWDAYHAGGGVGASLVSDGNGYGFSGAAVGNMTVFTAEGCVLYGYGQYTFGGYGATLL
jgi:hypothetical protein